MTIDQNTSDDQLVLFRNSGREVFPVVKAGWDLRDEGTNTARLSIYIGCASAIDSLPHSEPLKTEPFWELDAVEPGLNRVALVPGKVLTIPQSKAPMGPMFGGTYTNFYYDDHIRTERNTIKIIEATKNSLLVEVSGECEDLDYYDGSKPQTRLVARAWLKN